MPSRKAAAEVENTGLDATRPKPGKLPPLPELPTLAGWLRERNRHQDGPDTVYLACHGIVASDMRWSLLSDPCDWPHATHAEQLPGDGKPLDVYAAARRLLSEARLAGFR